MSSSSPFLAKDYIIFDCFYTFYTVFKFTSSEISALMSVILENSVSGSSFNEEFSELIYVYENEGYFVHATILFIPLRM